MTPDTLIYSVGICYASVCTCESDEDAAAKLNTYCPTGTSGPWVPSGDAAFADGTPNPTACPDDPARRHILFNC